MRTSAIHFSLALLLLLLATACGKRIAISSKQDVGESIGSDSELPDLSTTEPEAVVETSVVETPVAEEPVVVVVTPSTPVQPTDISCTLYTSTTVRRGGTACAQMFTNVFVGYDGYYADLTVDMGPHNVVAQVGSSGSNTPDGVCFSLWTSTYVWAGIYKDGVLVKQCPTAIISVF